MFYGDPINRIGYKRGVIIGLLIGAVGSALFYPAAMMTSYPFFLLALFVVGLGLAMLQIAANPYVTILGPERTASSRLNLSQAFNSFGTTIGPIIGGFLVFTYFTHKDAHGADSVKIPYLGFAAAFVLLAVFFKFAHVPAFTNTDQIPAGAGGNLIRIRESGHVGELEEHRQQHEGGGKAQVGNLHGVRAVGILMGEVGKDEKATDDRANGRAEGIEGLREIEPAGGGALRAEDRDIGIGRDLKHGQAEPDHKQR